MQGAGTSIVMDPEPWRISAAAVLAVYSAWSYRRSVPPLPRYRRSTLAAIRIAGFTLLAAFSLDPSIVTRSETSRLPAVVTLIDVSRSMSVGHGTDPPRIDTAARAARDIVSVIEGARVETIPFAGVLSAASVSTDSIPGAKGEGTDIFGALDEAARRYSADNLAAVVLISDGRITRGVSRAPRPMRVPVFSIAVGDTVEEADLSVDRVEYERTVFAGTRELVRAVIRHEGAGGGSVVINLIGGGKNLDRFTGAIPEGGGLIEAGLRYVPSGEGVQNLEVSVDAIDGEVVVDNNRELFKINVLKDRVDILYIDSDPDWNMTFLRGLCGASRRLRLDPVVRDPAGGYRMLDGGSWVFPGGEGGFSGYDLVIVGDAASPVDDRTGERLGEYIASGGALLLLASERSPLASREQVSSLRGALPVAAAEPVMVITGEFDAVVDQTEGPAWLKDIPISDGVAGRLPPLAAAIEGLVPTAGASVPLRMTRNGRDMPLLVMEKKDRGISAVMLGFPIWRWRLAGAEGEAAYNGLFGGLIQYMAEGRKAPAIDIQSDRTVYRAGERPRITVFPSHAGSAGSLRGEVYSVGEPESPLVTFIPEPDRARPGVFKVLLGALPPGEYIVRMISEAQDGETGSARFTVEPLSVEMLRTSIDIGMLAGIAESSGGALLRPEEVGRLPGLLDMESDTVVSTRVRNIRGKLWLLALIVGAFASEWTLRRYWGLV